jgi:hypothetical protein
MKVYYDKDCDLSLIKGKTVAIIGYGSQGHAHAQNLNDSGVKVVVGLRKGGASWDKVGKAGLNVMEVNDAVKIADVVMILLPDEQISEVYNNNVAPHMKQGASLAFAHGFNVHYNQVVPRVDLDVWMVAPKAPGHTVRSTYAQGGGVPGWIPCRGEVPADCGRGRRGPHDPGVSPRRSGLTMPFNLPEGGCGDIGRHRQPRFEGFRRARRGTKAANDCGTWSSPMIQTRQMRQSAQREGSVHGCCLPCCWYRLPL